MSTCAFRNVTAACLGQARVERIFQMEKYFTKELILEYYY